MVGRHEENNVNPIRIPSEFDSDFHRLSHELRTPLNHINGFAELLLMDERLNPEHADHVRAILNGSDALRAAVLSYLDRAQDDHRRSNGPLRTAA